MARNYIIDKIQFANAPTPCILTSRKFFWGGPVMIYLLINILCDCSHTEPIVFCLLAFWLMSCEGFISPRMIDHLPRWLKTATYCADMDSSYDVSVWRAAFNLAGHFRLLWETRRILNSIPCTVSSQPPSTRSVSESGSTGDSSR